VKIISDENKYDEKLAPSVA